MTRFKVYMPRCDEKIVKKIEDAANEVVELLAKNSLSIDEAGLVLQNAQEFIKKCKFVIPEGVSQQ